MPDEVRPARVPRRLRPALVAMFSAMVAVAEVAVPTARAITEVPDEPGAAVLPDAPTLQVLAADVDGDGSRDVVRLVRGEGDAALAEVWSLGPGGWALMDDPLRVLAPARVGPRADLVYAGVPLRLLVHRVGDAEQVIVASQPRFEEIDAGPPCCLVLHRIAVESGELLRVPVAQPTDPIDAILAIDLDGDGTDELLTSTSLPPIGDISYPVEARVYRWSGAAFEPPTVTELPVGSGDSPFAIGDSDGRPGDEAAYISSLGPPGLYRVALVAEDRLAMEAFGAVARDALGVSVGDGPGLAVVHNDRVEVHRWPGGAEAPVLEGVAPLGRPELLGVVERRGASHLVAWETETGDVHVLSLPGLAAVPGVSLEPSDTLAGAPPLPVDPFIGGLVADRDGRADAVIFSGGLLTSDRAATSPPLAGGDVIATLLGAHPIDVVGRGEWLALLHSPYRIAPLGPRGGRFASPTPSPNAWTSIAPIDQVRTPELDAGRLDPAVLGAVRVQDDPALVVSPDGFSVEIEAPAGSRVLRAGIDPAEGDARASDGRVGRLAGPPVVVPSSGRVTVSALPGAPDGADPRLEVAVAVVTPAGHGYVASWDVQVLSEPPALDVSVRTPIGSPEVEISGRTSSYARVVVAGVPATVEDGAFTARVALPPWPTDVEIVATDPIGNATRTVVSAVGVFDYRALPWIGIVAALVAAAGVLLFLRVPRPERRGASATPTVESDGGEEPVLEELDGDEGANGPRPDPKDPG